MALITAYLLGSLTFIGALMGYIKKGSIPSLLSGGILSILYFIAGTIKNKKLAVYIALGTSLILLVSGLARCKVTNFEKTVPKVLAGLGLVSSAYYGYLLL